MILTRRTPRLRADNYLYSLTVVVDDIANAETTVEQFIQKMKLIASIQENVMFNRHNKSKRGPMLPEEGSKPLKGWLLDRQWLR